MSDLQRSFVKAKLANLPLDPPMPQGLAEEEDEQDALRPLPEPHDDDSSSASSASSTGTIRPSPSKHLFARPKGFVASPLRNALNTQSCVAQDCSSRVIYVLVHCCFTFLGRLHLGAFL